MRNKAAEIGNSVLAAESVSYAVAILTYGEAKVWTCLRLAASIGNDSDSFATMVGARVDILNCLHSVPLSIVEQFLQANDAFDLRALSGNRAGLSR